MIKCHKSISKYLKNKAVNLNKLGMIYGISIAEFTTDEDRFKAANMMKKCPHIIHVALLSDSYSLSWIAIVPPEKEWWLRILPEKPEVIGAKCGKVYISKEMVYPDLVDLKIPKPSGETAPCGTNCIECPYYKKECKGCPATKHYVGHFFNERLR
ncbi:MAG: hypothetical protein AB1779_07680 [Candidatus Thermoplasmatota archaeon]